MTDTPSGLTPEEEAALLAAIDLAGRTKAAAIDVGLDDDDQWYFEAIYPGIGTVRVDGQPEVGAGADAFARRLLTEALCTGCHKPITLSDREQVQKQGCRWYRNSDRWERGCDSPPGPKCPSCGALGSWSIFQPNCSRCGTRVLRYRKETKEEINGD